MRAPAILIAVALGAVVQVSAQLPTHVAVREVSVVADLTYVGAAVQADSGNLFLSQPNDRQLVVVMSPKSLPKRLGRDGEGPGEFRNVARVGLTAHGFWVFDARLKRVTFYSRKGVPEGSLPDPAGSLQESRAAESATVLPSLQAMIGRDSLLVTATTRATAALGGIGLGEKHFFVGRAGAGRFKRIATLPASTQCVLSTTTVTLTLPHCAIPKVLARPDGRGLVLISTVWRPEANVVVESRDMLGELLYRRVIPMTPPAIDRETMDSSAVRLKRRFPGMSLPRLPDHYPPLTGAIVASDGAVWLGIRGGPGAQEWRVLDPSGKDAGRVFFPPRTRIVAADRSTVWAVSLDEDDLTTLARYRIPTLTWEAMRR